MTAEETGQKKGAYKWEERARRLWGGQPRADHKLGPGRLDSCFGHLLFGLKEQMVF